MEDPDLQHEFFENRGVFMVPKSPLDTKIQLYKPYLHCFIEEGNGYEELPMGGYSRGRFEI